MARALEDFAQEADETAAEQRQIADDARKLQHRRDSGDSWTEVLDGPEAGSLLRLVRSSGRRIASASAQLMRTLARELRIEGLSHRQIARRLGVTHQRVTTILKSRASGRGT